MPINFTATYDDLTNDVDDVLGDKAAVAVTGPMWFEPVLMDGYRIPAMNNLPRPAGLNIRAFPAFLDTDGQLKTEPAGEVGVRLWANDPAWGMERLQYRWRAELTDQLGRPVPWNVVYFDAPSEDVTIPLAREMPKPRQKFGRGRPGYGIARDGVSVTGAGTLLMVREDGAPLGEVTIPDLSQNLGEAAAETIAYAMTFGQ